MSTYGELLSQLGNRYGVLAESNTNQLTVIATNSDIAVGDLFLLPCQRGGDRFYVFRTTQYANILNRSLEMNDIARNKLTMPGAFVAEDLSDEHLIQLTGMILGYAQTNTTDGTWHFHRPRRLPQHLSDVYHVNPDHPSMGCVMLELMQSQLGEDGLLIGSLLAGEKALDEVSVFLPIAALTHHIGIFGRTGCGKSNLMMVLLRSILRYNALLLSTNSSQPRASILAIDPHDEFRTWHAASGGADGIRGIVNSYSNEVRKQLVDPFYYLTAREIGDTELEKRITLSRADITPSDLYSVMEFSEQQIAFANQYYAIHGEYWIRRLLLGESQSDSENDASFLPGTISAVQRRLSGIQLGNTSVFSDFDPERGAQYDSLLPNIISALESGRLLVVDTTLMTELEQFLVTTIIARTLFSVRKALRSAETPGVLPNAIRQSLGNNDKQGQIGMRSFADEFCRLLENGHLPYLKDGVIVAVENLARVNVVVEEAPSVLNPARMRFGSVFRDISRQGRKFGLGLTVVSQQVSAIDPGVLTQINTEFTMALGNESERQDAIKSASNDLAGFEKELQLLSMGQCVLTASYRGIPIPLSVPLFDRLQDGA